MSRKLTWITPKSLLVLVVSMVVAPAFSQERFIGAEKFSNLFTNRANWRTEQKFGDRIEAVARTFIGTPYVGGTLERDPSQEFCFVTLEGLDCVTLVESSIALARISTIRNPTPNTLLREIQLSRYRGGVVDGYPSRLHYTTDWVYDNAKRGMMKDITKTLGGIPWKVQVSYMSQNPSKYPALKKNSSFVEIISEIENRINAREHFYIPKDKIAGAEDQMQNGDIIGFVTSTPGLDTSHVGLVSIDRNKVRRLLHASSEKKAVVLDSRISEYVNRNSKMLGIIVVRPIEK